MPLIHLTTFIAAPSDRVFDLARSINLHKISTQQTNERAIAGTTTGLIKEDETVTWEAKHLFKLRRFTSKITELKYPYRFIDTMIHGDFISFEHGHHFKSISNGTIMIDVLQFETPYGIIGKIFNRLYLKKYIEKFITLRNDVIKDYAETSKWKAILG